MAKKNTVKKKPAKKPEKTESEPTFPYTTKPGSLRKLLQLIPNKPKPPKIDKNLIQSWGYKDTNDYSMVRVLKAIGMLSESNEPNELYIKFMDLQSGGSALAEPVKKIYGPLFTASHSPYNESQETLKSFFHIHSGGGERCIKQQIETFKVLCEYTTFDKSISTPVNPAVTPLAGQQVVTPGVQAPQAGNPTVNINLHIHLPENKSRRDYECIIEDIGRYIFGRDQTDKDD